MIGRPWRRIGSVALVIAVIGLACGPSVVTPVPIPSGSSNPSASSDPSASSVSSGAPGPTATAPGGVDAGEGRLVWLVDAEGRAGLWTTDLAGGDPRPYLAGLDEDTATIHDPIIVGDAIAFVADRPGGSELRAVLPGRQAVLLLDRVVQVMPDGPEALLAVRDEGAVRQVVRVRLDGTAPERLLDVSLPGDATTGTGPFGVAVSPDGRTVAVGWVGGTVTIAGPAPSTVADVGAPLVVGDDGRLAAVIGRAGEAYLVDGGLSSELAPPDSDPLTLPGTGFVAWPALDDAGALVAIEVRDVLAGAKRTYPASGPADGIREFQPGHILLEATAFDPLRRSVGYLDLEDGRYGTFEASAPSSQP